MSKSISHLNIPGAKSRDLMARRQKFVARGVSSTMNVFAAKADGAIIEDVDGNRYIDFAGGIGAMNIGHARPEVTKAIAEQAANFTHTCFSVMMYESYVALAERIVKLAPGDFAKKAIFFNSGAEAVENAVKIARYSTGRPAIIAFDNGYHGRTLMTMTMTAKVNPYKYRFGPYATEVYRAPFPYPYRMNMSPQDASAYCIEELERMFIGEVAPDQVAAIVIEPVQGEGGFMVAPPGFLKALKAICDKHGILFVADEIQSGFCRTGQMFAVEHDQVAPDIMIVAKSMGAGMPISGVVGRADIMDAPPPGTLGGTYSGNPVACAAALAVLDLYEKEDFAARSREVGRTVTERFLKLQEKYPLVGDVRGLGGMVAMELVKDRKTKEPDSHTASDILAAAHQRGLVLIKAGMYDNVLRVLVPLCVTDEQLQQGLAIFEDAFTSVAEAAMATTTSVG
ncbi:MAG TPA: 4-aminobutyrate--2-oxoglutarate transaminase [Ktedonobacter sp.]|jgi:4-aminobutyrate aminotransferase/(S)-3-amino-2-methylpropionate transaminase|nr:4-aminobutyrate--2-oxoglutarate transaminase [Ktedonobacter sp.]HAG97505.1 4-aminobutyrate--2-oxoglutarate transaminase [Ktedonobacter sp.]HAT43659.1 4-aminobutyrate--2-oxoglutarate transaminase [Ktedonobacter sp.]HBE24954.1 4-aminobutyrate--2-oxoglutarate transaminase [Ktedonobacter sp.]HCF84095.1 4-aminobutyrate--2-oxoglutarate transaminase [Ktedonobacter sp.]